MALGAARQVRSPVQGLKRVTAGYSTGVFKGEIRTINVVSGSEGVFQELGAIRLRAPWLGLNRTSFGPTEGHFAWPIDHSLTTLQFLQLRKAVGRRAELPCAFLTLYLICAPVLTRRRTVQQLPAFHPVRDHECRLGNVLLNRTDA
jgi:hypothetical protein